MIDFHVTPATGGHRFQISQTVPVTPNSIINAYLPIWIPGSYTRRDFARFLSNLTASDGAGNVLKLEMVTPSRWQIAIPEAVTTLTLNYFIYGRDESVRGCYLDHERGIFNPCCACLAIEGRENEPQRLRITPNPQWSICGADPQEDGAYYFDDYQHLIDSPLMFAAQMDVATFTVAGVPHTIAVTGASWEYDLPRLAKDVEKICAAAVDVFGQLPPMSSYHFLLFVTQNGYGGLEHSRSTMLMAPRAGLPVGKTSKTYVQLLGLFSHEYFHTWNIKDLKPRTYQPYDLQREQPTTLLWLFEGFTAFFDNWLLPRAGVITREQYFELLSEDMERYFARRGRTMQTLAQSSFEAWTKLYNGGEDACNISTTYYVQGALLAFCLDIFLRQQSDGAVHLPRVMRTLWQRYRETGIGLTEASFLEQVSALLPESARAPLAAFIEKYVHSTDTLPLFEAAQYLGVHFNLQPKTGLTSSAGFQWQCRNGQWVVSWLNEFSPAAQSGLALQDVIVAVDRNQATATLLEQLLLKDKPSSEHSAHVFRDGVLHDFRFKLLPPVAEKCALTIFTDATTEAHQTAWFASDKD